MDFFKIVQGLTKGLEMAESLADAGEAFGLPEQVADAARVAGTLLETATNVKKLIDNGKVVASGGDAASVRAIIVDLQEANDRLAAKIAAS